MHYLMSSWNGRRSYSKNLYTYIQTALIDAIEHPAFTVKLPDLNDRTWDEIFDSKELPYADHWHNERLEFVGDGIIDGVLCDLLYTQLPSGTPGLYTTLNNALHSNRTFAHIVRRMHSRDCVKSAVVRVDTALNTRNQIKKVADIFETLAGALYFESGYWAAFDWVSATFRYLMPAAIEAHAEYTARYGRNYHPRGYYGHYRSPYRAVSSQLPGRVQKDYGRKQTFDSRRLRDSIVNSGSIHELVVHGNKADASNQKVVLPTAPQVLGAQAKVQPFVSISGTQPDSGAKKYIRPAGLPQRPMTYELENKSEFNRPLLGDPKLEAKVHQSIDRTKRWLKTFCQTFSSSSR